MPSMNGLHVSATFSQIDFKKLHMEKENDKAKAAERETLGNIGEEYSGTLCITCTTLLV